jgi:hypothetical protein
MQARHRARDRLEIVNSIDGPVRLAERCARTGEQGAFRGEIGDDIPDGHRDGHGRA